MSLLRYTWLLLLQVDFMQRLPHLEAVVLFGKLVVRPNLVLLCISMNLN